jgi:ABC-2 type transport system ATP-binding protein
MPQPALRFQQIVKRYGKHDALRGVSLDVEEGEFFALVGMNGAGKTTLVKSLLDFCAVDGGDIRIAGRPPRDTNARAGLAFLPERFSPPYYLTGREFLHYLLALHQRPRGADDVLPALAALDLDASALDKPVRTYSKGMTQKLGLAAAFLSGKKLLVLDEPMSGLDPKARALVKRYLQRLKTEGVTLFFSTHMLPDVEELCDRMAILHRGEVRFAGPPEECRRRFGAGTLEEAYLNCIE